MMIMVIKISTIIGLSPGSLRFSMSPCRKQPKARASVATGPALETKLGTESALHASWPAGSLVHASCWNSFHLCQKVITIIMNNTVQPDSDGHPCKHTQINSHTDLCYFGRLAIAIGQRRGQRLVMCLTTPYRFKTVPTTSICTSAILLTANCQIIVPYL